MKIGGVRVKIKTSRPYQESNVKPFNHMIMDHITELSLISAIK